MPDNVVIADTRTVIDRWSGRAVVLPAPLTRRHEALDQTAWFDDAATPDGACRIGLAHGSVADRLPGAAEAKNEIPDTRATTAGLSYLALGDWHGALRIADRTHYSGTPETDRHRANDSGSIHLVETRGLAIAERVEAIPTGFYRWERLDVLLLDGTCDAVVRALDGVPEPRRAVVGLHLSGSISLAERRRLDDVLALWDSRVHHLAVDLAALRDEPTADDLDAIDTAGFVRTAIDRLKARADDPADPTADVARVALRMMYLDHQA